MGRRASSARRASARRTEEGRLIAGQRLLATYSTDPGWHHERLLLFRVADRRWIVLTGDGAMYEEDLGQYAS